MLRAGLTGNVASGKSAVAGFWRASGIEVVDADVLARQAVEPGSPSLRQVRAEFGDEVIDDAGHLDRPAMRRVVFGDAAARTRLESIIHPEVARLRASADRDAEARGLRLIVHEIPLLFETGLEDEFDLIVLVDAPAQVRTARMLRERGLDAAEAAAIIEAQMPASEKRSRADLIIENDSDMETLRARAASVANQLLSLAGSPSVPGAQDDTQ